MHLNTAITLSICSNKRGARCRETTQSYLIWFHFSKQAMLEQFWWQRPTTQQIRLTHRTLHSYCSDNREQQMTDNQVTYYNCCYCQETKLIVAMPQPQHL